MKPKVYVVQNQHCWDSESKKFVPKYDYRAATEYGELVDLLSPTAAPFNSKPIIQELQEKLKGFTPDDYLLLVGNPVNIGMATAIAADYAGGELKVLQWSGKDRKYIPITIKDLFTYYG